MGWSKEAWDRAKARSIEREQRIKVERMREPMEPTVRKLTITLAIPGETDHLVEQYGDRAAWELADSILSNLGDAWWEPQDPGDYFIADWSAEWSK